MAGAVGPRAQPLAPAGDRSIALSQSLPRASSELALQRIRLIARTLEERPGRTSADLAERIGSSRRHVALLLLRLEEHGHVVRLDRRWFPGPEPVD